MSKQACKRVRRALGMEVSRAAVAMNTQGRAGYAFEFNGSRRWRASSDELWEIVGYQPTGAEDCVGMRFIDGSECVVFACPDGRFRAVTSVSCR